MKLEQIINLKLNNFEIKLPDTNPISKEPINLADYPWEDCIADAEERYGDPEVAKRVCGAIKALYAEKQKMDIEPNPCWEGYEPIGLKDDGSPNCVPIKENQSSQKFVIPSPESGEDEQKYISRCNSELYEEYPDDAQRNAICYAEWEKK